MSSEGMRGGVHILPLAMILGWCIFGVVIMALRLIEKRYLAALMMGLLLAACKREAITPPENSRPAFGSFIELQKGSRDLTKSYGRVLSSVAPKFPGVIAFGGDLAALDLAGEWEPSAFIDGNPNYWRALLEMSHEDPSVILANANLHAIKGLLGRAELLATLGGIHIGKEHKETLEGFSQALAAARKEVLTVVQKGMALHDKGKYREAIRVYDEVIAGFPTGHLAYYEKAFALLVLDKDGSENIRDELYAKSRSLYPFMRVAYQGTRADVINRQLKIMIADISPFVENRELSIESFLQFARGCEKLGLHGFAAQAFWAALPADKDPAANLAHVFYNIRALGHRTFLEDIERSDPVLLKRLVLIAAGELTTIPKAGTNGWDLKTLRADITKLEQ